MKKLIQSLKMLVVLGMAWGGTNRVQAQQDAMYTQFFSNQLLLNPAYVGSRDALSGTAIYRNQWTGFPGAPVTESLSLHAPTPKGRSGWGASLLHDRIGITDHTSLTGAYAYRIDFGKFRLSMGINGQVALQRYDWANAHPLESQDPTMASYPRPLLLPNFGSGIYLDNRKWFVGLSVPRMLETELDKAPSSAPADHLSQLRRHYYLSSGLAIPVAENLVLKPQVLLKFVAHAPLQMDMNLGVVWREKLWVGGTFRTHDSMAIFFQYTLKERFRLGYAFDYALTALNRYSNGTHELMLGFDLGKNANGFFHPRYF